ncbi:MAG: hypothetical protein NTV17_05555, partial [Burkholderiales bacterium]|nr:hypothetical protein [Burkholderiales bacterium]
PSASSGVTMYRLALFLLAVVASMSAMGQALPVATEVFTYQQSGNTFTFGNGSATSANASRLAFPQVANQPFIGVATTRNLPLTSGVNLPVTVAGRISNGEAARVIGRFGLRFAGALGVGVALYDLADELGYLTRRDGGALVVESVNLDGTFTVFCFGISNTTEGRCVEAYRSVVGSACNFTPLGFNRVLSTVGGGSPYFSEAHMRITGNCFGITQYAARRRISTTPTTSPATIQDLEDAIASESGWPSSSAIGRALTDAINSGESVTVTDPVVTGPLTVPMPPVVVTNPDGSVTTTTREKVVTYGPGATVSTSTRETTSTTSPSGQVTPGPVTVTPDEPVALVPDPSIRPEPEPEATPNCGLPDTPACILDPSGIPSAETVPTDTIERAHDPIRDLVQDPSSVLPQLPTISWLFALPTSCGAIDFGGAFDPFITQVDICQFQPMFHDIMSLVWALGGLFGAISMFLRSTPA